MLGGVHVCMDANSDDHTQDSPLAGKRTDDMLQAAEKINEDGLGRHLNFMSTLYYEVSHEAPFEDAAQAKNESDA